MLVGVNVVVALAALCETASGWPPIVRLPDRARFNGFATNLMVTFEVVRFAAAFPVVGVAVTHVRLFVTLQFVFAVTATFCALAEAFDVNDVGDRLTEGSAPACVRVNDFPFTVSVPERGVVTGFAS